MEHKKIPRLHLSFINASVLKYALKIVMHTKFVFVLTDHLYSSNIYFVHNLSCNICVFFINDPFQKQKM